VPGAVFLPIARLLAVNSLAARLFAWRAADPAAVKRLVASTGSHIDREGVELYGRLMCNPAHVMGTLQMMAGWDLETLARDLTRLDVPLLLLVGTHDGTVPPSEAERAQALVKGSRQVRLEGLGHLAHEEQPAETLRAIRAFADPLLA
jgi:magnesium chelatase accessory protein